MRLLDLVFIVSILFVFVLVVRMTLFVARGKWSSVRRAAGLLGVYLACYATALVAASLLKPRRAYAPHERECFDDWCVAAAGVEIAKAPGPSDCASDESSRIWIATLEVSSDAKRVRQRAKDATASLEDLAGHQYQPCGTPLKAADGTGRLLTDELGPGESFHVLVPFRLPVEARPAGVEVHHGAFPGIIIIGDDQSLLHQPTLLRVGAEDQSKNH